MRPGEFWEVTPADFSRMQSAYRKRQEMEVWPLRRIEAALWNVQIAKAGGTEIDSQSLYPLAMDNLGKSTKKAPPRGGRLSREQYQALMATRFPSATIVIQSPPDGSDKHSD